ncbi:MAG: cupin-like domain-containing protein, partial [Rubrivivax sp.]
MAVPSHSLVKSQERRGVDAKIFREEIVPAGQPVILRGLVADWPVVQRGKGSPMATCEYLMQFHQGATVPLVLGDPTALRHLFYGPDMARFNFVRRPASLLDCLRLLISEVDNSEAPAIYIDAQPLPDCLPGFTATHAIPMLDAAVVPNIWIGNAVKVQTHFDLKSNIACIVSGRRRFTVFPPDQLPNL